MLQNILRYIEVFPQSLHRSIWTHGQENSWYDVNDRRNVSLAIPETAINENYLMLKKFKENYEVTSGSGLFVPSTDENVEMFQKILQKLDTRLTVL